MKTAHAAAPDLSIVIPVYNEASSIPVQYAELTQVLEPMGILYEIVFVDDGSQDETFRILEDLKRKDSRVIVVRLKKNFGQALALRAGFDRSRGPEIVSMDGDLQYDPRDIPRLLAGLSQGFDIVTSWRVERSENYLTRTLPSYVANRIIRALSGVPIHDFGTTFKAYRREALRRLDLEDGLHRFIPVLLNEMGFKITEVPVRCRPRRFGTSHYGLGRVWGVLLDMIFVKFISSYLSRPFRMFGSIGLISFLAGFLVACGLTVYFFLGVRPPISHEILFMTSVLLMVVGVQILTFGLLAEITVKIFHKVHFRKPYALWEPRPPQD